MSELYLNFNFDLQDFDVDVDLGNEIDTRYCKPVYKKSVALKYKNAFELAKEIKLLQTERYMCIVDGSFIFGDFIQAFINSRKGLVLDEVTISTLSLSIENIGVLKVLMEENLIKKLNIIVSDFFYSHEKNKLVKVMYELLDVDDRFQLAVCRSHMKVTTMKSSQFGGRKYVMHGSANLRSSDNLEQFMIEECEEQYDMFDNCFQNILTNFATIKKSLRGEKLFNLIQ